MKADEYALLKQITELVAIVGEMKGKIGLLESENAFLREMLKGKFSPISNQEDTKEEQGK